MPLSPTRLQKNTNESAAKATVTKDAAEAFADDMRSVKGLLASGGNFTFRRERPIQYVAIIVVVDAEVAPVLQNLNFSDDDAMNRAFLGLAHIRSGDYGPYRLSIIKVAESKIFHRHYSGYSQAAALAGLVSSVMHPDIVISFGTAGGVPGRAAVGDVIAGTGCLFLDRLRTRSKRAFDWGVWGGGCVLSGRMASTLGLHLAPVASQIGYSVTPLQERIIERAGVAGLDMEAGPIAQILNQTQINFLALKVVSNGVYPGDPSRMESEYHDNREEVSRRGSAALRRVLDFLKNKAVGDLAEPESSYTVVRSTVAMLLRSSNTWYDELLTRLSALRGLTNDEQARMADALQPVEFIAGDKIIEYGEEGQNFFIIVEGTVTVIGRDDDDRAVHVCDFHAGDCVGELECMNGHTCVADVVAKSAMVRAARLKRNHFMKVMGPLGSQMRSGLEDRTAVDSKFQYYRDTMHRVYGAVAGGKARL